MSLDQLHKQLRAVEDSGRGGWGFETGIRTVRDFLACLNQIWLNAHAFNPAGSDVRIVAEAVAKKVKAHWEREQSRLARLRCDYVDQAGPVAVNGEVEMVEHIYCVVCGSGEDRGTNAVVLCGSESFHTGCGRAFHQHCQGGAGGTVPAGDWFCDECVAVGVPSVARSSVPPVQTEPPMTPLSSILYPPCGRGPGQSGVAAAGGDDAHTLNAGYHACAVGSELGAVATQAQFDRIVRAGLPGMAASSRDERVHDLLSSRAGLVFALPPGFSAAAAPAPEALSPLQDAVLLASTLGVQSMPFSALLSGLLQSASGGGALSGAAEHAITRACAPAAPDSVDAALVWVAYIASRADKQLWLHAARDPFVLVKRLRRLLSTCLVSMLNPVLAARVGEAVTACTSADLLNTGVGEQGAPTSLDCQVAWEAVLRVLGSHTNEAVQGPLNTAEVLAGIPHAGVMATVGPPASKRPRRVDTAASGVGELDEAGAAIAASASLAQAPHIGDALARTHTGLAQRLAAVTTPGAPQATVRAWLREKGVSVAPPPVHLWDVGGTFTGVGVEAAVFDNGLPPPEEFATPLPHQGPEVLKETQDLLRAAGDALSEEATHQHGLKHGLLLVQLLSDSDRRSSQ